MLNVKFVIIRMCVRVRVCVYVKAIWIHILITD